MFVAILVIGALAISIGLNRQTQAVTSCGGGTTCPYIKTFGADVFAGGWFNPNCSANYQNYQYGTPPDVNSGGILTYAKSSGNAPLGGSDSQYGAFSLGSIEGNTSALYGFYTDGARDNDRSSLAFANSGLPNGGSAWGGQYEGTGSQGHCIPDYYTSMQTNVNASTLLGVGTLADVGTLPSGNYHKDTGGVFTIGGGTVSAGTNVAIFVKGDVYISGNISYAAHNPTNVPKFALVVQGNIYVAPGVSQLTGWYIAKPASSGTPTSNDGIIWTCYDITTPSNASYGPWLAANCNNKLTVTGAVVAKYVNFRRVNGDIASAGTSEDTLSNALGSSNISEIINYTPDMVIGGPFFNSSSTYNLDSLINLPPIY